ncbi:MAG: response regulator [Verrucomicrobia bacterium]|nr:response regulator [Verrucomicrobiota bacterium]
MKRTQPVGSNRNQLIMHLCRLILFEDDCAIAQTARLGLEDLGYKVLAVYSSADDTIDSLNELKPDLVLMDIDLEGSMDGVEAGTEIHRRFGIPIVFTTGHDDEPTISKAVESGAFGYVCKPYSVQELESAIEMALYRVARDREREEILENSVGGGIKILMEILSVVDPESFVRGQKLGVLIRDFAGALGISPTWELEVGALVSHIGHVMIPGSVIAKHRLRTPLNSVENALLTRSPEFGYELLMHVPRLEPIARMVLYQNKQFDGSGFPDDPVSGPDIPIGSRMLRVLGDYVDLEISGTSRAQALAIMNGAAGRYDPKILREAIRCVIDVPPKGARPVTFRELKIGDCLVAPVETEDGVVMVAAGQTITPVCLRRLGNLETVSGIKEPIYVTEDPLPDPKGETKAKGVNF